MNKKAAKSIEESIAARTEIQRQIDGVTAEIATAARGLEGKKRIFEAASRSLDDFKRHVSEEQRGRSMVVNMNKTKEGYSLVGDFHESRLTPEEKEHYDVFSEKVTTANSEISAASDLLETLKEKQTALLAELPKFDDPLAEILLFQKNLGEAERKVAYIQEAISGQQDIISKANADMPTIGALLQKRQDILAEIATGNAMESALEELDKQIKTEQQKVSKAKEAADAAMENAQHAIAGLQRKLSAAQAELKILEDQKKGVVTSFLMFEAEKAGAEYLLLAGELVGRYRQLIALDTILSEKGGRPIAGNEVVHFMIPPFHVQAHEDDRNKGWIYDDVDILSLLHSKGLTASDLQAEKERIAGMGITI